MIVKKVDAEPAISTQNIYEATIVKKILELPHDILINSNIILLHFGKNIAFNYIIDHTILTNINMSSG